MNKSRIVSWFFLSLAIVTNAFTLVYSALPADLTNSWTASIANFFTKIINNATEKEVKVVPVSSLDVFMSPIDSYQYNYIDGYEIDEIPLGSAKQIECLIAPDDASNKTVRYYAKDNNMVSLSQSGNTVSVIGMELGTTTIYAENVSSGITASYDIEIVNAIEPQSFDISIDNTQINLNECGTINVDVDGGVLGHSELINSRYYDTRLLTYTSSDKAVCEIDNYGVIHPKKTGNSTISVSNSKNITKSIDIEIVNGGMVPSFNNLIIKGSNICYDNDMIKDQTTNKHHYQLEIYDNDTKLNNEDFIWKSSNELLVRVDKYGVMRGFRKKSSTDEYATITAISKVTGESAYFDVTVKEQLPSKMYYSIALGNKVSWNVDSFIACIGDTVVINVIYDVGISNKAIVATISDSNLADLTVQGPSLTLYIKQTGTMALNFESVANSELKSQISFEFLKAGAISADDISNVGQSLRKTIGHAMMFAIAQAFTFIAVIMFSKRKQLWSCGCMSLLIGLLISSISEVIQAFAPGRQATLLDVLINFSGVTFGALVVIVVVVVKNIIAEYRLKQPKSQG